VIDFWATWCEPCKESFPFYEKLSRQHGERVHVVGISVDDEPDGIAAFARETGVNFALAWDEGQAVARRYDPPSMPTSYIVDRGGIVRFVHDKFTRADAEVIGQHVSSLLQ
jgi:thiol-disulfide isomerase/thioredoxin